MRDSTDRREAILEAALVLFAERGFHGTAVPLVAEKAEVGAGTIYRYFESKEALVNVLYQRWKGRLLDTILDNFPFHLPMREQFRMFWRRWATFVLDNPTAAIFLELHHHAPYLDAESRAIEERVVQAAALFFDEARKQRLVRDVSTPLLLAVVHGLFVGIIRAHFEGRLVLDDNMLTAAETCCWEAIRA